MLHLAHRTIPFVWELDNWKLISMMTQYLFIEPSVNKSLVSNGLFSFPEIETNYRIERSHIVETRSLIVSFDQPEAMIPYERYDTVGTL